MPEKVLKIRLLGDTTNFQANWAKASGDLTRFASKAQAVGKSVSGLGRKMSLGLTLPIIAGLGAGVKAFGSFDKAMTESLAIMGNVSEATQKQMADLAKQMSGQSTFAAKELAESYFFLASAGLDATQSMAALPVVTKFAQAGAFDMANATDLLTDAYSALGPAIQKTGDIMTDMTQLGDILVKANTLANASVQQFSEALTNEAGAAMRNFGVEVEDGVAVLAAYADQGIKGAAAGSQFGRALRLLVKAQQKNSEEFDRMGIKLFDARGEMNSFADIAMNMENAFKGMSTQAKSAALAQLGFQARTQQAILPLIGASEKIREFKNGLKEAGGITAEVAGKQLKSFSNQITILKNKVVNAFAAIGETLIPTITKIAKKIEEWTAKFMALSPETKKMIANALLMVAALGPILLLVGKLIGTFGNLAIAVKKVGGGIAWLAANPMTVLALGIVAVTALVIKAAIEWDKMRKAQDKAADSAQAWKDTNAALVAQGTSLASIKDQNRKRWEQDADVINELNNLLKSDISLLEKMATIEAGLNLETSEATVGRLKTELASLQAEFDKSMSPGGKAESPFVPSEKDIAASKDFQDALQKSVFDQLSTEGKINKLIEERAKLQKEIETSQVGSKKFEEARLKALAVETSLRDIGQERAQEIKDVAGKQVDQSKQFAGAVEAGSVDDYKLRIRAGQKDKQLDIQKKQEKQLADLNKKMAESVDILRTGFEIATGQNITEVSIA